MAAPQLKLAVRKLLRAPLFSGVALITLAVGIGANAAIFSVVNGVLLEPLPYEHPGELVSVRHEAPGLGVARAELSQGTYFVYREQSRSFRDLGLWDDYGVSVTGVGEPERVMAIMVTDATLPLLGATAAVGRLFQRADDQPGAPLTAVLAHEYWQRRHGGDPGVLGHTVHLDGRPHEIIGVLAQGFRILERDAAVYITSRFDPAAASFGNFSYQAVARLAPGASLAAAEAELARLVPVAAERYPGPITWEQLELARFRPLVEPLEQELLGDVSTVLWVLLGTVGLVLLLACANVANLFLVQAELRQREVALRTALGAERRHIVTGFLAESLVLSLAAAGLGLVLAAGGLELLLRLGPDSLPRIQSIGIDGRVMAFTLGLAVFAGLLFGLVPALRSGRANLHTLVKDGGRSVGPGRERHRFRNGLVVAQVAFALVLLVGSGLMIRSVQALRQVDPGFTDPDGVLIFRLFVPDAELPEADRALALQRELQARLATIPGVRSVGATSTLDLTGALSNSNPIAVEGRPDEPGRLPPVREYRFVLPGYHETIGARLLAGRLLSQTDLDARAPVVVVNERLARDVWGSAEAAIGQRIRDYLSSGTWFEVVGVTAPVRYRGMGAEAPAVVYWPNAVTDLWQADLLVMRSVDFVVRAAGDASALVPAVRNAVWSVNRNLPLANIRTLAQAASISMARSAFAMVMLSIAAAVALLLGVVGIYGVISYIVSQQAREISVRLALGARPGQVRSMVVGQAARVTGLGVVIGLAGAAGLTRFLAGMLYGVRAVDLTTYGAVTVVMVGVALAASYVPAHRAASLDPAASLKGD